MTETRRKARIAMLQKGLTFADLAKQTGYSVATIHNLLSNAALMAKGRQAITNALQVDQLWPGVFVTERYLHIPASWGIQMEFQTKQNALDAVAELRSVVTRRGRTITFAKSVTFIIEVEPEETQDVENQKLSASSVE